MLARHGTVSAAAEALGVHRATVNRHIDTLESAFGTKLFQRHARGYTLTESGQEMLEVAARADEMFADLAGRNRGRSGRLSGKLVVTALASVAHMILPALRDLHIDHPEIELEFAATADLARLEHGEAHVAFRAGSKPQTPDYVVKLFCHVRFGLYASRDYVRRCGRPSAGDLTGHSVVGSVDESSRLPFARWMRESLDEGIRPIKVTDPQVLEAAVRQGLGIGFLGERAAAQDPDLIEILPPREDWSAPIWVVTHVDLHRTEKVQRFLEKL